MFQVTFTRFAPKNEFRGIPSIQNFDVCQDPEMIWHTIKYIAHLARCSASKDLQHCWLEAVMSLAAAYRGTSGLPPQVVEAPFNQTHNPKRSRDSRQHFFVLLVEQLARLEPDDFADWFVEEIVKPVPAGFMASA